MQVSDFVSFKEKIVGEVSKVIVGKSNVITNVLVAYLCGGHVLLEDLPGTGKTMLLRTFSRTIGGEFHRIQFTPDLMPSDLTGINFYNQKLGEFEFRPGPLFANVVLADEINRATPRTQSSLLEAMEERQITVDGTTYPLDEPFLVMATQNPLESRGTFPLPEAQIDRFFMRLSLGYMTRSEEISVLTRPSSLEILADVQQVVTLDETAAIRAAISEVKVTEPVLNYLMDIISATRQGNSMITGVSTRGALALYKASQVHAAFSGRDYCIPEDIKEMAIPVLAHRIAGGITSTSDAVSYLEDLMARVHVPLER